MRWKKSMVGMEILGTKDSGHHHTHEVVACPRKLRYKKSSSRQDVHIESSRSIVYREKSAKPIFYITCLSLSLLLRLSKNKRRSSEMEHFGDHEEQTSITIDQNEIPISDSEDDSISSSVFEEFGIFKSIGLTKIAEGNQCYEMIKGYLTYGMGKDSNVAAVHEVPWSGPNGQGRLEAFHVSSAEMVKSRGGNGNVKYAWVLSSIMDDYGLRHVLLCSVVLGKLEEVSTGSRQFQPSSNDFDSGVDNLSTPTRKKDLPSPTGPSNETSSWRQFVKRCDQVLRLREEQDHKLQQN
ncbi:hypothetical protein Vadar_006315 [Vaccinium darrowii]|uniref:Uncharacterized protein n=1 Tax=Vaccinium darrowii TaxID=229202 RepID=A0ACB7YTR6_9ERIC|nr:hypothetical protein Vadar_006315 [Vaccinium darrowii]